MNRCLACGGPIEDTLLRLGSPRCQDCRCARRPLEAAFARELDQRTNGNGHVPVSMTVRITDSACTAELLRFLRRRACEAELVRGDLVVVRPHPTLRPEHVRAELEILLAVWEQERPDARAFLVA
jgi:hypothetical protein